MKLILIVMIAIHVDGSCLNGGPGVTTTTSGAPPTSSEASSTPEASTDPSSRAPTSSASSTEAKTTTSHFSTPELTSSASTTPEASSTTIPSSTTTLKASSSTEAPTTTSEPAPAPTTASPEAASTSTAPPSTSTSMFQLSTSTASTITEAPTKPASTSTEPSTTPVPTTASTEPASTSTVPPSTSTPPFLVTGGPVELSTSSASANCDGYPPECSWTCGCPTYTVDQAWINKTYPGDDIGAFGALVKVPLKWNNCIPTPQGDECPDGMVLSTLYRTGEDGTILPTVGRVYPVNLSCNNVTMKYEVIPGLNDYDPTATRWWTCMVRAND